MERIHTFVIDEPKELLGEDTSANPQEYLMGAMNACILNTYVIAAAMKGIKLGNRCDLERGRRRYGRA